MTAALPPGASVASSLTPSLATMSRQEKLDLLALLEEKDRQQGITSARLDLIEFAKRVYPGFKVGAHHRKLAAIFRDVVEGKKKRVIINIAPRMGKLLADDTPVLTTRGWSTHGALAPGDFVFHPSGAPIEVLAVSPKAAADVRVEFFDGSAFWCHENHEWTLWNMSRRRYETVEAGVFLRARSGRWGPTSGSRKQVLSGERAMHHLPPVSALQFPEGELALHPYVLGAWLGDGSAGKACVTHSEEDQPYVDKIAACGYPVSGRWVHKDTGVVTTAFSGTLNKAGAMTRALRALGVYNDKHIPEQYLRASIEQRLELLAGLIDTDGHVDNNSRCSFTAVNRRLIDGVVELVRSFGWRASVTEVAPRVSSSGIVGKRVYWTVAFQPDCAIPTALSRKQITRFADKRRVGLKSVTLDPQGKVGHCITVDSADGLYLVGHALLPTHNSEFSSYLFPSWFLGRFPEKKIIMATHTASLSEDFGRRVRNLIGDDSYREVFPDTRVSDDQKSAGKWSTGDGGQYYAAGVGGALAGRGADLFVVDDPHSEQDIKANSRLTFDQAWSWYQTGPLQRLMPGGAIIVIMTRWSRVDLTGRLIDYAAKNPDSDQWEVVELPAILNDKSLWPEQWPLDTLLAKKASMDPRYWSAQYQQQPTADEVALIKREHWQIWEKEDPPECEWLIQSWDTAHETKTSADFSACTTWGVWVNDADEGNYHVILLDAFKARMEFPELKKTALKHYKKWEPDAFLVEKKAAGAPLIQELRRMGIPVSEFSPSRGNDKTTRGNAIADMFHSGRVWAPDARWAREVIDEVASFPVGEHDDYYDCFVGDTLISMADGSSKRIDEVSAGDYVVTPLGPRRVTATSERGEREVWELGVGDASVLVTGGHRVMTSTGWMQVDRLIVGVDTVAQALNGATPCPSHASLLSASRRSGSTDGRTAATPTAPTPRTAPTSAVHEAAFTAPSGSTTTGRSLTGTTCTTSTATPQTTASRTSSACRPSTTEPGTDQSEASMLVAALSTTLSCELRLLSGTEATPGARGTASTHWTLWRQRALPRSSRARPTSSALARGVARLTSAIARAVGSVLPGASRPSPAFGVVSRVRNTHTTQRVYDISVDDAGCFYANGLLAHNCTTQAMMRVRAGGFIRLETDAQDEEPAWGRKRAAYY